MAPELIERQLERTQERTPAKKRALMQKASDDYVSGRISVEEFEEIEEVYATDLRRAVAAIREANTPSQAHIRRRDAMRKVVRRVLSGKNAVET